MKPSIFMSGILGANTARIFSVERPPVTLFAKGLAGAEEVKLQILTADTDEPAAADFQDVIEGGTTAKLSTTHTRLTIATPGEYRLLSTATAGAVQVGAYN